MKTLYSFQKCKERKKIQSPKPLPNNIENNCWDAVLYFDNGLTLWASNKFKRESQLFNFTMQTQVTIYMWHMF